MIEIAGVLGLFIKYEECLKLAKRKVSEVKSDIKEYELRLKGIKKEVASIEKTLENFKKELLELTKDDLKTKQKESDNLEPIENKNERTYDYLVLKTDRGYFEDAWEEYGDVENFSFTDDIESAYEFIGGLAPSWGNAPKYLWNDKLRKSIDNLKEAQEYFGGEIIKVTKTRINIEKFEFNKE